MRIVDKIIGSQLRQSLNYNWNEAVNVDKIIKIIDSKPRKALNYNWNEVVMVDKIIGSKPR